MVLCKYEHITIKAPPCWVISLSKNFDICMLGVNDISKAMVSQIWSKITFVATG